MVAVVAAEEPLTAAKTPQPKVLTWTRPPGKRCTQGPSPLNISSAKRVLYRISPIQMNRGKAVRDQLAEESQALVAKIMPAGASAKNTKDNTPQAMRTKATHTPKPRNNSKATKSITACVISAMLFLL